jgi:hypothetical protein
VHIRHQNQRRRAWRTPFGGSAADSSTCDTSGIRQNNVAADGHPQPCQDDSFADQPHRIREIRAVCDFRRSTGPGNSSDLVPPRSVPPPDVPEMSRRPQLLRQHRCVARKSLTKSSCNARSAETWYFCLHAAVLIFSLQWLLSPRLTGADEAGRRQRRRRRLTPDSKLRSLRPCMWNNYGDVCNVDRSDIITLRSDGPGRIGCSRRVGMSQC